MNTVVLIPAYQPEASFVPYVRELCASGCNRIVAVDDGGGEKYAAIFAQISALPGCTVLTHSVNRGKGRALKTGYEYILRHMAGAAGVVTADCDGQHSAKDVLRLSALLEKGGDGVILGSRTFGDKSIPLRSRFGNNVTSWIFALLYGQKLSDTQTGLRGIPMRHLGWMCGIEGERFEYETNVLIQCRLRKVPLEEMPIETIYLNENTGSHFNPVKDSIRIYKLMLKSFFLFFASSLLCSLVDLGAFALFSKAVFPEGFSERLLLSTVLARAVSSLLHFAINRGLVFKNGGRGCIVRYYILAVVQLLCSWLLVEGLFALLGIDEVVIKAVVDVVLFFFSYRIQRAWVFRGNRGD